MEKFRTGNVVKLSNSTLVIIVGYRSIELTNEKYRVVDWISFDFESCKGCTREFTIDETTTCYDCDANDSDSEYCETCNGSGKIGNVRNGMDEAVILARNCKEYILSRLTKNFDF